MQLLFEKRIFAVMNDGDNLTDCSGRCYWNTNRTNWDSDGDKMSDGWEVVHNLEYLSKVNGGKNRNSTNDPDGDGISDLNEYDLEEFGAHPRRQDIFVEVDWMVKERKFIYFWTYVPQVGGGGEWEPLYFTKKTSYKMKEKSQFLVIKAFAEHNIGLHIDDGCMGGGNSISYISPLVFYNTCPGINNDFYDVKWGNKWDVNGNEEIDKKIDYINGNFRIERYQIFHYCIFGSSILTLSAYENNSEPNSIGQGQDYDDLILDYEYCNSEGFFDYSEEYIISRLFMHELCHNLGLHENSGGKRSVMQQRTWDVDLDYYSGWSNIDLSRVSHWRDKK